MNNILIGTKYYHKTSTNFQIKIIRSNGKPPINHSYIFHVIKLEPFHVNWSFNKDYTIWSETIARYYIKMNPNYNQYWAKLNET